ncbi:MAG: RNA polymerase sigma factor [Steroidobacteraceae bacterium]
MSLPQATPDRWMAWVSAEEPDWDALYSNQLPRVYNYFRFRIGADADAEDLTSRTFERAWRARERYRRDVAAFSTWLFTIAHNVAVDFLRARRIQLPIDAAGEFATEETPELDAEHSSDLNRLSESNVGTILHRVVQTLRRNW